MTDEVPPGTWLWLQNFGTWLFPWLFAVLVRRRVLHPERIPTTGAVVLVANHSSGLDGPVIASVVGRRPAFLIKQEMFRGPLGFVLRRVGQIPINRDAVDRGPLLMAVRVLRGGGTVGIFPEGTRGVGDVAQAHNGAAWLARSGDAVLLPVACRGTYRAPGTPRRWRPRVDVLIGQPFPAPATRGRAGLAEATEQVRAALAALVAELDRSRAGNSPTGSRKVESS